MTGLAADEAASETAITLLDDGGKTLQRAPVDEDGTCVLDERPLASAPQVLVGPVNIGIPAHEFRGLIGDDNTLHVAALLIP